MIKSIYDIFAQKWCSKNGSIYILSDPHFNDVEMTCLRKNDIGDDELVKRINSKVGKNDTVIFLGDIGDIEFIKRVRGYKVLIMGNHDKGASNYKREIKNIERCPKCGSTTLMGLGNFDGFRLHKTKCLKCGFEGNTFGSDFNGVIDNHLFDEVYEGPLMISDRLILSHEPITSLPEYMFNIHGHDHSGWFKSGRHLNVCVEHIDYTPLNLLNLLKKGLLSKVESIHRLTIDEATLRKQRKNK